jgi:hypothetical protein
MNLQFEQNLSALFVHADDLKLRLWFKEWIDSAGYMYDV